MKVEEKNERDKVYKPYKGIDKNGNVSSSNLPDREMINDGEPFIIFC